MKLLPALLLLVACKTSKEERPRVLDARQAPAPVVSVDARPVAAKTAAVQGARVKAESLAEDLIIDEYLVIVPDAEAERAAIAAAKQAAKTRDVQWLEEGAFGAGARSIEVASWDSPLTGLAASDVAALLVGVDPKDLDALVAATRTVHLELRVQRAALDDGLVDVATCAVAAANAAHGWVMDVATYQIFAPAVLAKLRTGDVPIDARRFTTVRGNPADLTVMETKGMHRLGLPDLILRDIPPAVVGGVVLMLNATSQHLIEQGQVTRDGELDLDLASLGTRPWPQVAKAVAHAGGSGVLPVTATWSRSVDDATVDEIELTFAFDSLGGMLGDATDYDPGGYFVQMRD